MSQSRGLHHVDLVVSDVKRSRRFYSEFLRPLGWGPVLDLQGERGEAIWYLQSQDTWLGLRQKQSDAHPVPYDRYAVGVHHVAFEALSLEAVDGCWEWVLTQDVATESAPKEFPHYAPGYYAAFFYDPDGIKLEVVYEPTRAATTSSQAAEACDHECRQGRAADHRTARAIGRHAPARMRRPLMLIVASYDERWEVGAFRLSRRKLRRIRVELHTQALDAEDGCGWRTRPGSSTILFGSTFAHLG